jgi:peptide chain release factor 2
LAGKEKRIAEADARMAAPDFWDRQDEARRFFAEITPIKAIVAKAAEMKKRLADAEALVELVAEGDEADVAEFASEIKPALEGLRADMDRLEIESFLSGPHDRCNAIITIHAGAGGTESCDWADMLLRLYTRWGERRGFQVDVQDIQAGDEAGISKATLRLAGENAYGYAKAERGVHRLVRISPFDANKRRHTSFASVDVIAEIEDDAEVELKPEDMRIDTYRSSGKGGQHVNKTESAIRITHLPTGIVVTCQNERSQIKNKETALRTLRSRLAEKMEDDKRTEMERFYGEKGEIGWGNQIRSYVFQPYQMVKDLRTGCETGNIQAVMDGDIDAFVNAWLRAGCPKNRNKDFLVDD